jgi:hypothetical protein
VRQRSTASDLVQIALAVLQPGAAPADPRPTGSFPRSAVLQVTALLCAAAALGCGLVALWISTSPVLGAAGASLVVAAVLCAVAFAAFVFEWRTRDSRAASPARSPIPSIANDALLAGGSSFFRQHPVLTLAAAVLAGVLLGGEY